MCNLPQKVFWLGYPVVLQNWFLLAASFFIDNIKGTRMTTVHKSALNAQRRLEANYIPKHYSLDTSPPQLISILKNVDKFHLLLDKTLGSFRS